jgi:hypothetical protein
MGVMLCDGTETAPLGEGFLGSTFVIFVGFEKGSFSIVANTGMKSKHLSAPGSYTVRHTESG